MEAPEVTVNGKRPGSRVSLEEMVSPTIVFPYEDGKLYNIILATFPKKKRKTVLRADVTRNEEFEEEPEEENEEDLTIQEQVRQSDIIARSILININPSAGRGGQEAMVYDGPVLGTMLVLIYEQSGPQDVWQEGTEVVIPPGTLEKFGLTLRYTSWVKIVRRTLDPGDPSRGGFLAVLKRALQLGHMVDVSALEPGLYGKGIKAKSVMPRNLLGGNRVGLLNVPDFPIVSRNPQGWDLAMEILAWATNNPSWAALIGKWGTSTNSPGIYDRETLRLFLEGAEYAPSKRLT